MKNFKFFAVALSAMIILSGCGNMNNTTKGGLLGGGGGAALGALAGYLIGKDAKGAAIGAAVGGAVGTGAGVIIGKKMDKAKAAAEAVKNAQVQSIQDANGLQAVQVTFDSGILFDTNKADLKQASKNELSQFAAKMQDMEDTDITIFGHTDNTGTYEVNQKVSNNRADAVEKYLKKCGIATSRMTAQGLAYDFPIADNETVEGRAQNRRVEIYITANEEMIEAANNGTLE